MRIATTSLAVLVVLALGACGTPAKKAPGPALPPPIVVPLAHRSSVLTLTMDQDGVQHVDLCTTEQRCKPAPNGPYRTEAGTRLTVKGGEIYNPQQPTYYCSLAVTNGREHIDCEDRD